MKVTEILCVDGRLDQYEQKRQTEEGKKKRAEGTNHKNKATKNHLSRYNVEGKGLFIDIRC